MQELKVYNRFDELILHLEYVPHDAEPMRIVEATPELREALRTLARNDFDRTVAIKRQLQRFTANWRSAKYLEVLADYLAANFKWTTKLLDKPETQTLRVSGYSHDTASASTFAQLSAEIAEAIPLSADLFVLASQRLHDPTQRPTLEWRK